jgi:hypothetical protein
VIKFAVNKIEKIINTHDKWNARRELDDYFIKFSKIPRAVVACPGGVLRSELIATYLEGNKMAVCPLNTRVENKNRMLTALCYKKLTFFSDENNIVYSEDMSRSTKKRVDIAVLCDDHQHGEIHYNINRIIDEIDGKIPILLLEGMEGHFTYFCWNEITI